jgi:hypothetical protein
MGQKEVNWMGLRVSRWMVLAGLLLTAPPLHAQGYCAQFSDGTSPDCSFTTRQMCEASVTGIGGVCLNNPYPQSVSAAPPPPLPLPPGQTNYQLFPTTPLPSVPSPSQPPCNPIVDGTYCASAGGGTLGSPQAQPGMAPIQSMSSDLGIGSDPPATLGGINFSGGETCIALFRRMSCGGS